MFSSRLVVLLLVGAFFAFAAASALPNGRSFVEESTQPISLPAGWKRISTESISHSERKIELLIAVKRRNVDVLEETFWAVSDPQNELYGQHLSFEALTDLVGPTQSTVDEIVFWLKSNGVHDVYVSQGRDYIRAFVSVHIASRLFEVKFHQYKHQPTGKVFAATLGPYTVPHSIAEKIDLVTGLVGFPDIQYKPKIQHHKNAQHIQAKAPITPAVIRARYNITDNIETPNPKNGRAVAEFQAQYYSPSDLQDFYNKFVHNAPFQDVAKVIGFNNPKSPGLEASLDIQYISGVVPNITTWFYSMKNFNFWNDLVRWTAEIANETQPPLVHSVSYGEQGDYPSVTYRDRLNSDFLTLGARGISIIFASGDDGAGCGNGDDEFSFAACDCSFYPSFPATCPYTTSVGATAFITGNTGAESAVKLFKSGGGFSYIFGTTSVQDSAVHGYLASGVKLPEACAYNASGRATPDVSALGDEAFQVYQGGSVTAVGGTSASAPTFSAIISLLNEQRLNAGNSPLGFLNPWIYQSASTAGAFYDVTIGDNKTPACCKSGNLGGFECAKGYDPVTGVGTPNYAVLKTLV